MTGLEAGSAEKCVPVSDGRKLEISMYINNDLDEATFRLFNKGVREGNATS